MSYPLLASKWIHLVDPLLALPCIAQQAITLLYPSLHGSLIRLGYVHRDLSIHSVEPDTYQPKLGIVKALNLGARSQTFLFTQMVQNYGNRSTDNLSSHGGWAFSH